MIMILGRATALLMGGAVLALGTRLFKSPAPLRPSAAVALQPAISDRYLGGGDSLRQVIERDPFRSSRRPAKTRFDPSPLNPAPVVQPVIAKPVLAVTGISIGRDTAAILEGLPGADMSTVVHSGQVVGGLRVRQITSDAVIISGLDTSWTLRIRRPWQ